MKVKKMSIEIKDFEEDIIDEWEEYKRDNSSASCRVADI
jgi:hypothetical protein